MLPIQITFRSMPVSPTVEYLINKYYKKINRIHSKIARYHATVSLIHKHRQKGKMFNISLELTLPNRKFICKKTNKNIYLVIKEAFDALENLIEKQRKKKFSRQARHCLRQIKESAYENAALSSP